MNKKLRILLLEDLPTDAELIVDELELSGLDFQYQVVDNEQDFLQALAHFKPHIVLSDYMLPTFNGMAALAIVKERYPTIPVIMVTASINEETAVACMRAGAVDYILKDKMKRLGMAVRSVLKNQALKLEKEKAEEALKESGRYYRALLDNMNEHVIVIDREFRILDANKTFLQRLGLSRPDVIGKFCYSIKFGYDKPCNGDDTICQLQEVLKTGKAAHFIRPHKIGGQRKWCSISLSPMVDKQGEISSVIESSQDITELMQAQEEIQKLLTAIEQSPVSVLLTDTNGVIEYVNPHFYEVTGYSQEEVLGKKPNILKSGVHNSSFYADLWGTISQGKVWHGEFNNRKKNGSLFLEDATISPVFNETGEITHYLAVKEDITEQKRLEQELQQAAKMEAVGRLAGGIAHDFNNLLTVINGYSDMALSKLAPDGDLVNYLTQIARASRKASQLTEQLLAFSRKQVARPVVLDTNKVIEDTANMLERVLNENIFLELELQQDLPPIKADPAQFDQVLINLAINARDAMPQGGKLTIRAELVKPERAGIPITDNTQQPWIQLTVNDTGIGIDEETLEHIFEPFFSTKGKKGAGLGMAMVYGVISQNGWHIDVTSKPGEGSTFCIYIPTTDESVKVESIAKLAPTLQGKETILFAEDEKEVRAFVASCLSRAGYRVIQASDGAEALELALAHADEIDLLLSDVIMPNMSGKQLADQLKEKMPELKVIFISGYTDDTLSQTGVLEQGITLLQKPFMPLDLLKLVRQVLDTNTPAAENA